MINPCGIINGGYIFLFPYPSFGIAALAAKGNSEPVSAWLLPPLGFRLS